MCVYIYICFLPATRAPLAQPAHLLSARATQSAPPRALGPPVAATIPSEKIKINNYDLRNNNKVHYGVLVLERDDETYIR